jgi:outer membrane receptor protein involved in Fe transport
MVSNSTYDAQINQLDRRWIMGGRHQRNWQPGEALQVMAGGEFRYDDIGRVGLQNTDQGEFVDWVGVHAVREASASLYGEASWQPSRAWRVMAGLRADAFDFRARERLDLPDQYSGNASDTALSPKLTAAYAINDRVELYANWGRGFHSNDARGVIHPLTPAVGLSPATGKETGARFEVGTLKFTATYWWLDLDSELKFVGDSNSVEPGPATRRRGYEVTAFWRPLPWMAMDAVWTGSHGRFLDSPGAEYIPGAVENAGEFGVTATTSRWDFSTRVRYLGSYPLIEDNSERADPEMHVNLRAEWRPGRWHVYGEVLNLLDNNAKDIAYWYESYIDGFDAAPTEGRMSRVSEPRTLRIGVKYRL